MRVLAGIATAACFSSMAFAGDKDAGVLVTEATQAFADGDYAAALEAYQAAELALPESPEVAYNQGVAYYKLGDYTEARHAFNRALLTRDPGLEARIKFNLGNLAYASALEDRSNLPKAADFLKTAIGHYRDAIELDPKDEDARINIELAQLLLRDLLDKLSRQQEKRRQRQDDQGDRQDDEEDRQPGGSADEQQPTGAERPQAQRRQQADEEMTGEERERLLQAVRDKERQRCEQLARRRSVQRAPVSKDW